MRPPCSCTQSPHAAPTCRPLHPPANFQSVMESPDRVSRVTPPITTIVKTHPVQPPSHHASWRRAASGTPAERRAVWAHAAAEGAALLFWRGGRAQVKCVWDGCQSFRQATFRTALTAAAPAAAAGPAAPPSAASVECRRPAKLRQAALARAATPRPCRAVQNAAAAPAPPQVCGDHAARCAAPAPQPPSLNSCQPCVE
jgi:hypothetical protein